MDLRKNCVIGFTYLLIGYYCSITVSLDTNKCAKLLRVYCHDRFSQSIKLLQIFYWSLSMLVSTFITLLACQNMYLT